MQIPGLLHGPYDEVDARCDELIARLGAGTPWLEAFGGELLDSRVMPGLLVLNGPSPLLATTAEFQCYVAHFRIRDAVGQGRLPAEVEAAVFAGSLQTSWGVLGLLAPANVMWAHARERHRPLLEASLRYWDVFDAEQDRYTLGMPRGEPLWSAQSNLKYVMAQLGVPISALQAPLPSGGLQELVDAMNLGRH
jgi:hypothetical protein